MNVKELHGRVNMRVAFSVTQSGGHLSGWLCPGSDLQVDSGDGGLPACHVCACVDSSHILPW